MIDRVAARLRRRLLEVPVGFKWFVEGLVEGAIGFLRRGERGSDLSTARRNPCGRRTRMGSSPTYSPPRSRRAPEKDPGEHYRMLTAEFGPPNYTRVDAAATAEQKTRLEKLSAERVRVPTLAGEPISTILTKAPGNDAPIGGLRSSRRAAGSPHGVRDRERLQNLRGELPGLRHLTQSSARPRRSSRRGTGDTMSTMRNDGESCTSSDRVSGSTTPREIYLNDARFGATSDELSVTGLTSTRHLRSRDQEQHGVRCRDPR